MVPYSPCPKLGVTAKKGDFLLCHTGEATIWRRINCPEPKEHLIRPCLWCQLQKTNGKAGKLSLLTLLFWFIGNSPIFCSHVAEAPGFKFNSGLLWDSGILLTTSPFPTTSTWKLRNPSHHFSFPHHIHMETPFGQPEHLNQLLVAKLLTHRFQ